MLDKKTAEDEDYKIKMRLSGVVKNRRKRIGITQKELADKSGLSIKFIRAVEQGKQNLMLDKVNQLLWVFGLKFIPVSITEIKKQIAEDEEKQE